MNIPSRVQIAGPLAAHKDGLIANLHIQGYTSQSSAHLVRLMAHLSHWLGVNKLRPEDFTIARMDEFIRHRHRASSVHLLTRRGLRPIMVYLRCAGILPAEDAEIIARTALTDILDLYGVFLVHERALRPQGVRQYQGVVRHFLLAVFGEVALDLNRLTAGDVSSYIVGEVGAWSVGYAKQKMTALRSFLRYLHVRGEIPWDLTGALPPVVGWQLAGLPKALAPEEANRLLGACDRRTRTGRRDYAVLVIMLRLGLRAIEVASLTLDDFNWSRGEILVRGKGGRLDHLPLPQAVGEAVVSYLRQGRPRLQSRSLFLGAHAPYRDMSSSMAKQIVSAAGYRCGFQHLGAHRLRHTTATNMLRNGASLREIGQVLRHRSVNTAAIYAKVDHNSLRTVCRPWPGATS